MKKDRRNTFSGSRKKYGAKVSFKKFKNGRALTKVYREKGWSNVETVMNIKTSRGILRKKITTVNIWPK